MTHNMSSRRFGVEIECYGISQQAAKQALHAAGLPCYIDSYNHATPRKWKISTDGSIDCRDDPFIPGLEVISPPLKGKRGLKEVAKAAQALKDAGCRVNKTCGFHVHVDAAGLKKNELFNAALRYKDFEKKIDGFMPSARRRNSYCMSMKTFLTPTRSRKFLLAPGVSARRSLKTVLNSVVDEDERYYKLNVAAFLRHGTVEFRHHNGTVDGMEMVNWIQFCLNFVETSKLHQRQEPTLTIEQQDYPQKGTEAWKMLEFAKMLDALTERNPYLRKSVALRKLDCTAAELDRLVDKIDNTGCWVYRTTVYEGPTIPPAPEWSYSGNNRAYYAWLDRYQPNTHVYYKSRSEINYYNHLCASGSFLSTTKFQDFLDSAIPRQPRDVWHRGLTQEIKKFYEKRQRQFLPKSSPSSGQTTSSKKKRAKTRSRQHA